MHDLYRAGAKRLCNCNQASDECEYAPLITCEAEEEGREEAGNVGPINTEEAQRVAELQSWRIYFRISENCMAVIFKETEIR